MRFKSSFPIPVIAAISFCLIGPTFPAAADILHVPGDFPTIQAGIDAAVNGDEVVVADGVYTGDGNRDLDYNGKLITVRSENGPDNCIIDCQGSGRGFFFHSGETSEAALEGFTITNGSVVDAPGGGAILCSNSSSPAVSNCTFSDNWAAGFGGGGLLCVNSSPTLIDCTFTGNSVSVAEAANGGGLCNVLGSHPMVVRCTFAGNFAFDFEDFGTPRGGAVYNSESSPSFSDCTFRHNSVNGDQSFGQGGGVYNGSNSNSTFTNCVFAANNAGGDGASGGAMYNSESDPLLINCLFTNNEACEGAGGMTNNHSNPVLINCTFSHTLSSFEGALLNFSDSNPVVIGCILWDTGMPPITGRATVAYSCIQGGWRGIGNIEANPMFVDPDGPDNDIFTWEDNDYRLSSGSQCIDAGNNWGVPVDELDYDEDGILCELFPVDLDGNPRFNADEADVDPGCGVPVVVDMGAYEYQFDPADQVTFADLNADGVVGAADLLVLLVSWGTCGKGCCLADLNIDGTVGATDLLALLVNWGPCP